MSSRLFQLVDVVICSALLGACSAGEAAKPSTKTTTGGAGASSGSGSGSGAGGSSTGGSTGAGAGTGDNGGITPTPIRDASSDQTGDACSSIRLENEIQVITTTDTVVTQSPVDLYFIVDHSGSMDTVDPGNTQSRWQAQSQALNLFIDQSTVDGGLITVDAAVDGGVITQGELGMGLGWFPITTSGGPNGNSSCVLTDYVPVVPIANLPGNGPALKTAIAGMTPSGRTPTRMAMLGAVQYATTYQAANPKRAVAIVLATDGIPNDCQSTVPAVAAVAATAFMGTPPISTYVLGVGPETGNLDQIAQSGGTKAAYMVTNSGASALLAAMNAIRTQVTTTTTTTTTTGTKIACTQPLDVSQRGSDWAAATMTREVNGKITVVPPVADLSACGTADGWYYDDPKNPTKLVFCPGTCDALSPEAGISKIAIDVPCVFPKRPPS